MWTYAKTTQTPRMGPTSHAAYEIIGVLGFDQDASKKPIRYNKMLEQGEIAQLKIDSIPEDADLVVVATIFIEWLRHSVPRLRPQW